MQILKHVTRLQITPVPLFGQSEDKSHALRFTILLEAVSRASGVPLSTFSTPYTEACTGIIGSTLLCISVE